MSTICYSPIKEVDDVIADKVMGWDSYRVATLRGMYDESHDSPVDTSDLANQDVIVIVEVYGVKEIEDYKIEINVFGILVNNTKNNQKNG